ncbi:conjugal transfer nickase/helicase domain-containing protein [Atlantibacter hermannii]|uniref:conjugal transfer nickase/helicase domain-containing protein n=1 Tax=Atlantibacter hermannii TaxID=565 RepID=UPI0022B77C94|nr:DNA-binding domain-containing protein [Atlantibacter hermannii]MCZ7836310.1 DNA-binding domain-containing protein [Atlantibacter hermannii]
MAIKTAPLTATQIKNAKATGTRTAFVHLVNDEVFLVTPGIFKGCTKETTDSGDGGRQQAQKDFQARMLSRRNKDGVNI